MTFPTLRSVIVLILACVAAGMPSCTIVEFHKSPSGGYYSVERTLTLRDLTWGLVKRPEANGTDFARKQRSSDVGGYWRGEGVSGRPRIVIDLSDQVALFYKGDRLVGSSPVCTGSAQFPTPVGSFRVIEKDADHYSSVYGDWVDRTGAVLQSQIDNRKDPRPPGGRFDGAKMFWFMRINGGVGMHEGYLPGYADSHGCIRLPSNMARIYFANAPVGTPVKIVN